MPAAVVVLDCWRECGTSLTAAVNVLEGCSGSNEVERFALITAPGLAPSTVPWSDLLHHSVLQPTTTEYACERVARLAATCASLLCLHRRRQIARVDFVTEYELTQELSAENLLRLAAARESLVRAGLEVNIVPVGTTVRRVCPALARLVGVRSTPISGVRLVCPGCRRTERLGSMASLVAHRTCEYCH